MLLEVVIKNCYKKCLFWSYELISWPCQTEPNILLFFTYEHKLRVHIVVKYKFSILYVS